VPKRSSKPKPDENQIAAFIKDQTIDEQKPKKNPAAVALGRLGGLKGGPSRAAKLSKEKLSKIGKVGAKARWKNHKKVK